MKRETSITLTLVSTILAGGFLFYTNFSSHQTHIDRSSAESIVPSFRTIKVQNNNLHNEYSSYGSVVALKNIHLKSLSTGKVSYTHDNFIQGGLIQKDEVILTIDTVKLKLLEKKLLNELSYQRIQENKVKQSILNLKDSIQIAKENFQLSKNELDRSKVMMIEKTISLQSYEATTLRHQAQKSTLTNLVNQSKLLPHDLQSVQSQIEKVLIQLQETKVDIKRSSIKAPFTLKITKTFVNIGQFVSPNTQLCDAYDAKKLDLVIEVPSSQTSWLIDTKSESIADLNEDNFRTLKLPDNLIEWISPKVSGQFKAKNIRVSSAFDPKTRNLKLFMELQPQLLLNSPLILPGSFAKVSLKGKALKNAASVPTMSIFKNQVQVIREGLVHTKDVSIIKSSGSNTYVVNNFQNNDVVLLRFRETLVDGTRVNSVVQE
ncbi:hypothetical protein MJH12_05830 [bacterium]|nr:hypothetical protein [bacterium]